MARLHRGLFIEHKIATTNNNERAAGKIKTNNSEREAGKIENIIRLLLAESRSWKVGTGMPVSPFVASIYNTSWVSGASIYNSLGSLGNIAPSCKHCSSIGSPLCEGRPGHHNNLLRERERGERERGRGRQRGGEGGEERERGGCRN